MDNILKKMANQESSISKKHSRLSTTKSMFQQLLELKFWLTTSTSPWRELKLMVKESLKPMAIHLKALQLFLEKHKLMN